jgi:hypothetical protein
MCYCLPQFTNTSTRLPLESLEVGRYHIEQEAHQWALELVQLPFYPTIFAFTLAFAEWLETCDIRPLMNKGASELVTMSNCLRLFDPD